MAKNEKRITLRVSDDTNERLSYWAEKRGLSRNQYIVEAIEETIRRENLDYDLPTLEIARLNQLIDVITLLSSNVKNLEEITITSFESLLKLTRGDNYLFEDDEEESV